MRRSVTETTSVSLFSAAALTARARYPCWRFSVNVEGGGAFRHDVNPAKTRAASRYPHLHPGGNNVSFSPFEWPSMFLEALLHLVAGAGLFFGVERFGRSLGFYGSELLHQGKIVLQVPVVG